MKKVLLRLVAIWFLVAASGAQTTTKWFVVNPGFSASYVEDDSSGQPTASLIYVPTSVAFSNLYFNVYTTDSTAGHYYDIGIGKCPSLDCSQPSVQITIICNLGSSGSSGQGVSLTTSGVQSMPCAQGTVTISPGVYILLGTGNAKTAKCLGGASAIMPTAAPGQASTDGSLTNPNSTVFTTGSATGSHQPGNPFSVSLH